MKPELSAIVATLNRPAELRRLLGSIARQRKDTEVLVVDQSDPEFAELNQQVFKDAGLPGLYLHTAVRSTSHARNMGIRWASGAALCFPDDDCEYPDGTFDLALRGLTRFPLFSGQYVDWDGTRSYFPREACDLRGVAVFGRLSAITFFVLNQGARNIEFDSRLGGGGELGWAEEIDYGIRYIQAFGTGRYDPALTIYHKVGRASTSTLEAQHGIDRARGYVLVKNWRAVGVPGFLRLLRGAGRDVSRRRLIFLQGARAALRL